MGQQEHGISDGLYTYKHHHEGGADIHTIFVKKSTFRVLLSYIGTILLLATVCCALLSKLCGYAGSILFMSYFVEFGLVKRYVTFLKNSLIATSDDDSLCLGSLWSISFASIIAKCLRCDPVKKESLVIMPTFGVQLEQHFWSGRVHRKFVPIGKILKPVLNEHVTPVACYWSLALLLREEYELMLVFKNLNPPVKMLVPIWKALCASIDSKTLRDSALPQSTKRAIQGGGGI